MSDPRRVFRAMAQAGNRRWFDIRNEVAPGQAEIYLYDPIGGWFGVLASEFVRELSEIEAERITVHINSPGGDVFDGIAIMNALRHHSAHITCVVDGLAASAASIIAVGGSDDLVMSRYSELMIHDAWGFCMGPAADMAEMATRLNQISDNIAEVYTDAAGGDTATWRAAMLAETWYSAQEAVDAGLADRLDEPRENDQDVDDTAAQNSAALAGKDRWAPVLAFFDHAGRDAAGPPAHTLPAASAVAGRSTSSASASEDTTKEGRAVEFTDEQLTTMRQTLGVSADITPQEFTAALTEALAERAEDPDPAQTAAQVPEGMVLMDQATVDELRAGATAGREAQAQQQEEHRAALVQAAINDGRIAPARREGWMNTLRTDPGSEQTLADLAPGLIPLAEMGHAGESSTTTNSAYDGVYGAAQQKGA